MMIEMQFGVRQWNHASQHTLVAKRQIGGLWKALTSKEQQLFKDMERMEFDEKAKKKALPPAKPRKD